MNYKPLPYFQKVSFLSKNLMCSLSTSRAPLVMTLNEKTPMTKPSSHLLDLTNESNFYNDVHNSVLFFVMFADAVADILSWT